MQKSFSFSALNTTISLHYNRTNDLSRRFGHLKASTGGNDPQGGAQKTNSSSNTGTPNAKPTNAKVSSVPPHGGAKKGGQSERAPTAQNAPKGGNGRQRGANKTSNTAAAPSAPSAEATPSPKKGGRGQPSKDNSAKATSSAGGDNSAKKIDPQLSAAAAELEAKERLKREEEEAAKKLKEAEEETKRLAEAEEQRLAAEQKRRADELLADLKSFASLELKSRKSLRELRDANLRAATGERPDASHFKTLNSTIAKCSAFAKRCNKITSENGDSLLKESKTLNLSKYVSEVASQIATSTSLKAPDIEIAVLICSEIHQKYADFASELHPLLQKAICDTKDSPASPERRIALRLYSELYIAGVLSDQQSFSQIIKETIEIKDPKLLPATLQLVLSFVRSAGRDILGIISKSTDAKIDQCIEAGLLEPSIKDLIPNLIAPERRASYNTLVSAFYQKMSAVLVQSHKKLREVEQKNHDSLVTRHEISAEAAASYSKQLDLFENFQKTLVSLSDMLRLDMPILPISDKVSRMKDTKSQASNANQDELSYDQGPWESEESKKFYESLPDLKDFLPAALLSAEAQSSKTSASTTTSSDATTGSEAETSTEKPSESSTDSAPGTIAATPSPQPDSDSSQSISAATQATPSAAQVGAPDSLLIFFEKLQRCSNRQLIDDAALEFVRFNQKSWRPKLAQLMHGSARNRLDVLRYFSRFVAIMHPYFKDIGVTLVKRLEDEFYSLLRQKDQTNSPSKIWNARFLAELTKFRVCPPNTVLNFLKQCLDDFIGYNVHVVCELVDSCGRWLVNLPETRVRANNLLDHMAHLKNSKAFHVTLEILIDNALQTARPPERVVKAVKQIPPIHQYIQRLLFLELRKDNLPFIVTQLKKLRWNSTAASAANASSAPTSTSTPTGTSTTSLESDESFLLKTMLKVYKNKYQHIGLVSSIIAQVSAVHDGFGVKFLDHLLEEIRRDLDVRKFSNHQKLVMNVSLAGELINHKLADHRIFYKLLYSFIRYNTITAGPKSGGPSDFTFRASSDASSKYLDPFSPSFASTPSSFSQKEQQREIAAQTHAAWVEDSFRVRLVCTLLTTCRTLSCFSLFHDTQAGRMYARDLEAFLIFFQRFLFAQKHITTELNSLLDDTWYLVRPPYLLHSMEEADTKLKKLIAARRSTDGVEERFSLPYKITTSSNASQLADDEEEADNATDASQTETAESSPQLSNADVEDSLADSESSKDSSTRTSNTKKTATPASLEEEELGKMFDSMLLENISSSRGNVNTRNNSIFQVPLMVLKRKAAAAAEPVSFQNDPNLTIPAIDRTAHLSNQLQSVKIEKSPSVTSTTEDDGEEENEESDFEDGDDGESAGGDEEIDGASDDGDDDSGEEDDEQDEGEEDEEEGEGDSDDVSDEEGSFPRNEPRPPSNEPPPVMQFQFLARKPGNKPVMGAIAIPVESSMVKRHIHAQDVALKQREQLQAVTMKLFRMEDDTSRTDVPGFRNDRAPQPVSYAAAVEVLTSAPTKGGTGVTSGSTTGSPQVRYAKR